MCFDVFIPKQGLKLILTVWFSLKWISFGTKHPVCFGFIAVNRCWDIRWWENLEVSVNWNTFFTGFLNSNILFNNKPWEKKLVKSWKVIHFLRSVDARLCVCVWGTFTLFTPRYKQQRQEELLWLSFTSTFHVFQPLRRAKTGLILSPLGVLPVLNSPFKLALFCLQHFFTSCVYISCNNFTVLWYRNCQIKLFIPRVILRSNVVEAEVELD